MRIASKKWLAVFVLPTFIAFCIAFLVPFIMGLYLSFCEFRTVSDAQFVGLQNYIRAFSENGDFINSLWFTVRFAFTAVISINVTAFLLALLLTRGIRGTNLFRTVFFMRFEKASYKLGWFRISSHGNAPHVLQETYLPI